MDSLFILIITSAASVAIAQPFPSTISSPSSSCNVTSDSNNNNSDICSILNNAAICPSGVFIVASSLTLDFQCTIQRSHLTLRCAGQKNVVVSCPTKHPLSTARTPACFHVSQPNVSLSFEGCTMRGTAVDMDSPQGTLTIRNSVLDGLEQHRPLRVENVESVALQDSLVVRGLAFDGSEDGGGCALLRDISNSVTMDNVTFHSCDTEGNGGCLAVTSLWRNDATTSLIISNSSFERCSAGNVGGMVFAFHALSVDVTHSTFRGGSSNGDGGGIAVLDVETLRMRYVTMYNCTTDHTAGCAKFVAKLPSHTIDILDSQFLQCTARYGVGCIGIQGATFSLNNTNVDHCNATASTSGCVGLSQTKGVLGNTRLSNCYAANDGGGLRISASNVSLTHVALESVRSESGSGGGLYASDKSFVEFENVTIQNAFARHNGTCFLLEKRASAHFVKDIELQCGARHYDVPSRTILVSWVNMTLTENDIFPRKEENQSLSPSSDSPPSDDLGTKQSSTTSSSSSTTMRTSSHR
eukprot:PhF_6_TR13402/c0_g1_i2/m.21322